MSLVRLLTAGKSLVGSGENQARYRLWRGNWLPKFESAKNPFASTVTQAEVKVAPRPVRRDEGALHSISIAASSARIRAASEQPRPVQMSQQPVAPAAKETAPVGSAGPVRMAVTAAATPSSGAAGATRLAGVVKKAGQLLAFFDPFSVGGGARRKSAGGARAAGPVQGELSLDNVKVVRNDLSDADVEVVPLRSATEKEAGDVDTVAVAEAMGEVRVGEMTVPGAMRAV